MMQQTTSPAARAAQQPAPEIEHWARALVTVAHTFDLAPSLEQTRLHLLASPGKPARANLQGAAEAIGMTGRFVAVRAGQSTLVAPFIAQLKSGDIVVVRELTADNAFVLMPTNDGAIERNVTRVWLDEAIDGHVLALAPRAGVRDHRIDAFLMPYRRSWFRRLLAAHSLRYVELAGGAFCANILALATAIFSMQIWDRVIPAQSLPTLWVLALGVGLALTFELILKLMRVKISDGFGKQLDLKISTLFFARALDLRNDKRPKSAGTLIAQLRELDQIRDLMTSTTLSVLFEIPFVVTFMFVIALIGGPLVYVVLAVVPVVLLLCLVIQWPMARLSRAGLRESAMRNALLVESIERIEDIKSLQAEARFTALWEHVNSESGKIGMKNRFLSALLTNLTQTLQQAAYAAVLVAGVYLVLDNAMTTGALLACSMLTSRAIAPLAMIAGVFARLQSARVAREGLDAMLKLPTDHGASSATTAGGEAKFHRPQLKPEFIFDQISHAYDKDQRPALVIPQLTIKPGERIALIGRIGSGKSTLLKLAAGLMPPSQGRVLVDGTDMAAIEMADIRRDIGSFHQDAGLFFGTVRYNLQLAAPTASDEALIAALESVGPIASLFTEGRGLDMLIQEGGRGLSSGQRQALMLARALVRQPRALLLDEPTGSMDEATERAFLNNLRRWLGHRTLIVATHRYAALDIVDRVIVVDGGRIVMDGPKADVIRALSANGGTAAAPAANTVARPGTAAPATIGATHAA